MRNAFSMVELIFVIVLMGILASIGSNILPDNRLLQYTNEVIMQIKETQKNAIGNDINGFGALWSEESNSTCILLDSSLHVAGSTKICFDEYGRPYDSSTAQLLLVKKDINVTYNGESNTISVFPMSGYVTLSD
jgi:prepilin-type N-terminal cleavage/methylation domain-containing protein